MLGRIKHNLEAEGQAEPLTRTQGSKKPQPNICHKKHAIQVNRQVCQTNGEAGSKHERRRPNAGLMLGQLAQHQASIGPSSRAYQIGESLNPAAL